MIKSGVITQSLVDDRFNHPEPCFDISSNPDNNELQAYYSFLNVRFIYQLGRPLPLVPIVRELIENLDEDVEVIGRTVLRCGFLYDHTFKQKIRGRIPERIIINPSADDVESILHHEAIHVYCMFYYGDHTHSDFWHEIAKKTRYKKHEEEVHIEPNLIHGMWVEQV